MEFALQATPIPTKEADSPALETAYVTVGSATGRLAAVYCVRCGAKYARTDDACPSCGQPIQEPIETNSPDDWRLFRKQLRPIGGYRLIVGVILIPLGLLVMIGLAILTAYPEGVAPRSPGSRAQRAHPG